MARILMSLASGVLLTGCSFFGIRSGYEQPPYELLATLGDGVEIRRYGPRLAAETEVESTDAGEARNQAFRVLAAYIFGENRAREEVAMTAPVEVERASEPIAMTAPVEARAEGGRLVMRFFMPSRWTRETLPEPLDPRVRIVEVPGESVAVLRFSGFRGTEAVRRHEAALLRGLAGSGWRAEGAPSAFFYDPPWTLPFLRRNEVAVPVARVASSSD